MEFLQNVLDIFLHLDKHLGLVIQQHGNWTYLIVSVIIFCETGLVVTPFLPGDSLLFALGSFAAIKALDIKWLIAIVSLAAILGNTLNYWIGHLLAPRVFRKENIRFIKKEYLERTEQFFAKYGGKTIIITRFFPIIRTFAPFLAGVGSMKYWRFALYNLVGGVLWVVTFTMGGYLFGNLPVVKKNFTLVIFVIIVISILPAAIEFWRHKKAKQS